MFLRRPAVLLGAFCVLAAALAAVPSLAAAKPPKAPTVLSECSKYGQLTTHFTAAQLQSALNHLPADSAEYTNCSDVIHRALAADLREGGNSSSGSSSGGGSSFPVWLIVLIVVLVLAGGGGALAARRRPKDGGAAS